VLYNSVLDITLNTQHNYNPDFNYFEELINWANKR